MSFLLIRSDVLVDTPPGASVKDVLRELFEKVRDDRLSIEEALKCVRFEPTDDDEAVPRIRFASPEFALRLLLTTVKEGTNTVEAALTGFDFPDGPQASAAH